MSTPAFQSKAQVQGFGTVLSIGGPTGATGGTETFTLIGEPTDLKFSGSKTSTTMSTSFASQGLAQKLGTITDLGTATFTCNRIGNDPGQLAVRTAQGTRQAYDFQAVLPPNALIGQTTVGDTITFSGIITEAGGFDVSTDKLAAISFTVDLNSYTVTLGS